MGTQAWFYVVPHEQDLQRALEKLREREFIAGRYHPANSQLRFSLDDHSASLLSGREIAPRHSSIDAAREAAAEDGTKSIVDVDRVGAVAHWGVAAPIEDDILESCLGSTAPELQALRDGLSCLLESLSRGESRYVLLYERGLPTVIVFLGLSFD